MPKNAWGMGHSSGGAGIFIEKGVPCQPAPLFEKMPVWDAWSMGHRAQGMGHGIAAVVFLLFLM